MLTSPCALAATPPPLSAFARFPIAGTGGHALACLFQGSAAAGEWPLGGANTVFVLVVRPKAAGSGQEAAGVHWPTAGWLLDDSGTAGEGSVQHVHFVAAGVDQGSQPRAIAANIPRALDLLQFFIWTQSDIDPNLGSSTSSLTIAVAVIGVVVTGGPGAFTVGLRLRIDAGGGNWMQGAVVTYDSTTSTVLLNINQTNGAGTFAAWTVRLERIRVNNGTSATNRTIAIASISWVPTGVVGGGDEYYTPGAGWIVRMTNGVNWAEGLVTAYTPNVNITINVTATNGAGTFAAWTISAEFTQSLGRDYNQSILNSETAHLAPYYVPPILTAALQIGLSGCENEIVALMAATDAVAYAAMKTPNLVGVYGRDLWRALSVGRDAPAFTNCSFRYLARQLNPSTTWANTQSGVGLLTFAPGDRPPAVKTFTTFVQSLIPYPTPVQSYPRVNISLTGWDAYSGDSVDLQSSVSSAVGLVRIDWILADNTVIGSDTGGTTNASATWVAPAVGVYTVRTRATWDSGLVTISAATTVRVWASALVLDPPTIFAAILKTWLTGRLGITAVGVAATAWLDQQSGVSYAGTATYTAADASLVNPIQGARPTLLWDGIVTTGNRLTGLHPAYPSPLVTPIWVSEIGLQVTTVSGRTPWASAANVLQLTQDGAGNVSQRNGGSAANNTAWGLNKWKAVQVNYAGTIGVSYVQVGANTPTATQAEGSTTPAGTWTLGARVTATQANVKKAEVVDTYGTPSAVQIQKWCAYLTHWYSRDTVTNV